jgi:hypothetical protein
LVVGLVDTRLLFEPGVEESPLDLIVPVDGAEDSNGALGGNESVRQLSDRLAVCVVQSE